MKIILVFCKAFKHRIKVAGVRDASKQANVMNTLATAAAGQAQHSDS